MKIIKLILSIVVTTCVVGFLLIFVSLTLISMVSENPGHAQRSTNGINVRCSDASLQSTALKLQTTLAEQWCLPNLTGELDLEKHENEYVLSGKLSQPEVISQFSNSISVSLSAASQNCLSSIPVELRYVDNDGTTQTIRSVNQPGRAFETVGPSIIFFGDGIKPELYQPYSQAVADFFGEENGFILRLSGAEGELQLSMLSDSEELGKMTPEEREKCARDNAWLLSLDKFNSTPLTISYCDRDFQLLAPYNMEYRAEPVVRNDLVVEADHVTLHSSDNIDPDVLDRIATRSAKPTGPATEFWFTRNSDHVDVRMVVSPDKHEATEHFKWVFKLMADDMWSEFPSDWSLTLHACSPYMESLWSVDADEDRGSFVGRDGNRFYYFSPFTANDATEVLDALYAEHFINEDTVTEFILFDDDSPVLHMMVTRDKLTDEDIDVLVDGAQVAMNRVFPGKQSFFGLMDLDRNLLEDHEWVFNELQDADKETDPVAENNADNAEYEESMLETEDTSAVSH